MTIKPSNMPWPPFGSDEHGRLVEQIADQLEALLEELKNQSAHGPQQPKPEKPQP